MKKIIAIVLALMLMTFACAEGTRVAGLKGPTSIGLMKLLETGKYDYTLAGSADELTPLMLKGELDIMLAPLNLASVLYNKTEGGIELLAVCTLGVVSLVEIGEPSVNSLAELKGKTIYATGKGSIPEFALRYLLEQYGLDPDADVTIEWKSEPVETIAALEANTDAVGLLPQPYLTVAQTQNAELRVIADLTEEWDKLGLDSRFITAGVMARKAFVEENPDAVAEFLADFAESVEFVNASPAEAAPLVEKYDIVKAAVAEKAIPGCNIVCITGDEMKTAVQEFMGILYEEKPEFIGGKLPEEDFYYIP